MNIQRLTTNLPSIRIHDHPGSFDSGFDDVASARAMRSQPRDIPFKHSSPISIAGSFNASDVPPPLLPIHPIHPSDWDSRSEDRHGTPKSPKEWGSRSSIGRGYSGNNESSKGSWDIKSQDDGLGDARNGFERLKLTERQQSGSLQSEESLRRDAMSASMTAYDRGLLRKLSPIPPRNNQRMPFSPVDDGPSSLESDFGRRPGWKFTPTSSPIAIGFRPSESSVDRWPIGNARKDSNTIKMALLPEQNPPVFPSSMDYRNTPSDTLSVSSFGHNEDSFSDHIRSPISGSLLGNNSFDDSRGRLPLRLKKSHDRMGRVDDDLMMEDSPSSHLSNLRHLNLGSETPPRPSSYSILSSSNQRAGSKRRASSPPNDEKADLVRKSTYENGEAPNRRSPTAPQYSAARYFPGMGRYHSPQSIQNASTGSSFASSTGTGWSNSLASSIVSVATNYSTQDRSSPGASFSPPSDIDTASDSPYMSTSSSRRANRQRAQDLQIASLPDRDVIPQKLSPVPKLNGVYVCECCPKKPKKFNTQSELQMHEMEKQYTCNFCSNRFKNKNEAERHQNSLHLRKSSWSCAALSGVEAAFHQSSQRPGVFDVCGYCGKEFPAPANWDLRREHLTTEHKFGECNQAKKFFRADHFRQHLKHSHSGTAGKWTNVLENACMRDEPGVDGSGIIGLGNPVISEE